MSKRGYISRYLIIIKKLKAKPYSTFEELQGYVESQVDFLQMQDDTLSVGFSRRTLQRDLKEIRNIFGIEIEYSKKSKGYFISQNEIENMNFQRMMEAFDMFNTLNISQDLAPFILLENRKPQGTDNLYGLLHAIKNRLQIKFSYQKFWEEEITYRTASPYALKEFKNRWYVMARENEGSAIKSFALDRLTNLEITNRKFELENNKIEEKYRYCFGIISPGEGEPLDIILSFDPVQGKYIKTLPLHHTQQIVVDNEDELQIKLKLYATHDFIMELLSFGNNVKVLQPKSLVQQIKTALYEAAKQYE